MIEYNVLIKWGKHNKILKHETKTLYTKQFMNNCRIMIQQTFRNLIQPNMVTVRWIKCMYSCHHLSTQFLLGQSKTNLIVWGGRQNKLKCRHCVSVLKHSSLLDIGSGVKKYGWWYCY